MFKFFRVIDEGCNESIDMVFRSSISHYLIFVEPFLNTFVLYYTYSTLIRWKKFP